MKGFFFQLDFFETQFTKLLNLKISLKMSKVADRCNGGIKYFGFINQKEFGFDILGLLYV